MTISFSGLVSGLDTSSWVDALVSVKQSDVTKLQTQLKSQQSTKTTLNDTRSTVSSLRTAIEKLTDAKFGGTFDLFAKSNAASSNEDIFTATATSSAKKQNYEITVKQIATSTKAVSQFPASSVADDATELKSLGISNGKFTVYVDGVKNTINIADGNTVGDLKEQLENAGVKAEINEDGVINMSAKEEGKPLHIGTTTDTSNFVSLVGLTRQEDGSYASTNSVYKATISSKLTSEGAGFNQPIKAGTFTIGSAEFTIDENTTLSSLIYQINSNADAQANAYWDDTTGRLSITSTKEGASYINIEAGTSNFTDVMGLTSSTWDEEGNIINTQLLTEAQEIGKNAIFSVNGTEMTATSNTITSDISRLEGITLTLKKASTEEDGTTSLRVSQDSEGLKEAIKGFVSAYNNFIDKIDTVTASGAELHGESSLTSLKNTVRNYANGTNTANGGIYRLLSDIGISTTKAEANNLSSNTNVLHFDEDKFMQALEENPDSVRAILGGDNSILTMMEGAVEQSLKAQSGFFDIKTATIDSNIKRSEEKVKKKNESISTYKAQLEKKFQSMESMIAAMQQNYSQFSGGISLS